MSKDFQAHHTLILQLVPIYGSSISDEAIISDLQKFPLMFSATEYDIRPNSKQFTIPRTSKLLLANQKRYKLRNAQSLSERHEISHIFQNELTNRK